MAKWPKVVFAVLVRDALLAMERGTSPLFDICGLGIPRVFLMQSPGGKIRGASSVILLCTLTLGPAISWRALAKRSAGGGAPLPHTCGAQQVFLANLLWDRIQRVIFQTAQPVETYLWNHVFPFFVSGHGTKQGKKYRPGELSSLPKAPHRDPRLRRNPLRACPRGRAGGGRH